MKTPVRSTLYLLIEAGQHAHRMLLRPLIERGLEAGDDAVLLLLGDGPLSESGLEEGTATALEDLRPRIERLVAREFVVRTAGGLALTERGARFRERLAAIWAETEVALTLGLKKKERRKLDGALLAFAEYLNRRGGIQ